MTKILKGINTKKAGRPDKISGKLIKVCKDSLLFIVHIFNLSLCTSKFPALWKTGEIIPIPKKDICLVDNDLRPVTLTSVLSKCLEKLVREKLLNYVSDQLDQYQFAYLSGRSTDDAICSLIHNILKHLDKDPRNYVRSLFVDYSAAFNTIQPHIMIQRLLELGIPSYLQLWILDFLTHRVQYVKTANDRSPPLEINTGAPHCCVLSPLLFVLYTNALKSNCDNCCIFKYADDTVVLGLITDSCESDYRNTIESVNNWCGNNHLDLNVNKTKEVIFDFRRNKSMLSCISINNNEVEIVTNYNYLGVTLDDKLNFEAHVNNQIRKANKRLYFVRNMNKLKTNGYKLVLPSGGPSGKYTKY